MTSTGTEPPLAQPFKGAPHILNHATPSPLFPQTTPEGTRTVQSKQAGFLNHHKKRFLLV